MGKFSKILGFVAAGAFGLCANASTVDVNVGTEYQVIRGFGGMVHNAWQGGAGLSEADAKLAFGTGDGQIGLNTLRIPVYANSSDFSKEVQAAKYAKKYAGDDFILYATPWTSNYAGAGQHISSGNYQNYVNHLNDFSAYMKNQGVPLYAISISNEPDWCNEWACWSADEIYNFTKNYGNQLRKNGTKVISTESFAYRKELYNKVLNDADALKNWDILGAHFYGMIASTGNSFFEYSLADQKKVERWMTEHYTESQGSGNYWRKVMVTGDQANAAVKDTVRAMDVAYEIHRGLVNGNFSQYTWWYIRRCYGLIMEKDFGNKLSIPADEIGKVSKRGYVLSQYARFIRPGAKRISATANPEANVYASAYKSADGDSTIVVLVNRDYKNSKKITVNVKGTSIAAFKMYTTSESKNAKYEGEVKVTNGSATITMESGSSNKDCIVTLVGVGKVVNIPQEPFKTLTIPGKIEMEDFDIPGVGTGNDSYYDTDAGNNACKENSGSVCSEYRKDTDVDIKKAATGHVLGWNSLNEWLEYTVNVESDGDYTMYAAVSASGEGGKFKLLMDGVEITDDISVPAAKASEEGSENFNEFNKVKANVSLKKGKHVLRLLVTGTWFDIDYINFDKGKDAADKSPITSGSSTTISSSSVELSSSSAVPQEQRPYGGKSAVTPGRLEIENYDVSGVDDDAYYHPGDITAGDYREDDIGVVGGGSGYAIAYTAPDEWLEYTVNAAAGEYDVVVNAASGLSSYSLKLYSGDDLLLDEVVTLEESDRGWNYYKEHSLGKVTLAGGEQVLKLVISGYVNLDYIDFKNEALKAPDPIVTETEKNVESSSDAEAKSSSSEKSEAIFADRLNMRCDSVESYDVFDMQGNFVGRLGAYSMGEALSRLQTAKMTKSNGMYFVRSEKGYSKAIRIIKK